MEGPKKLAEFSFIGFDPKVTIEIKNNEATIRDEKTGEENKEKTSNPLKTLKKFFKYESTPNNEFRLIGGAIGHISYDAIRYWEKIPKKAKNDLNFPDIQLGIFDDGIVFDHKQKKAFYYYQTDNRLLEVKELLKKSSNYQTNIK